ncbi:hypothetical protein NDU88_007201 [Pleurodeles waltl]|uniref:Uncharacterized protein n=1 Tax=Pleurodeles waltl TaxID=8319 RepID=A0AAV7U2C5_PLEWA|nr:hypothetical protein NDU88_007201 [Pleurodeles waltl]
MLAGALPSASHDSGSQVLATPQAQTSELTSCSDAPSLPAGSDVMGVSYGLTVASRWQPCPLLRTSAALMPVCVTLGLMPLLLQLLGAHPAPVSQPGRPHCVETENTPQGPAVNFPHFPLLGDCGPAGPGPLASPPVAPHLPCLQATVL